MSELIRFECPQCRKSLSAKPQHAGRSTKCPECECLVKVPSPVVETEDFFQFLEDDKPATRPTPPNPRDELFQRLTQAMDSGATAQALAIITQLKVDAPSDEFNDLRTLERELKRGSSVAPSADSINRGEEPVNPQPDFDVPSAPSNIPVLATPLGVSDSMPTLSGPPPNESGTKPCPFCAEMILAAAKKCKHCGEFLDPVLIRSRDTNLPGNLKHPNSNAGPSDEATIRRIADFERLLSVMWGILGVLQLLVVIPIADSRTDHAGSIALALLVTGLFNIRGAIHRWRLLPRIMNQDATIPNEYESLIGIVVAGIINLILGGVIGIVFAILDLKVRDMVLTNKHLFQSGTQSEASVLQSHSDESPKHGELVFGYVMAVLLPIVGAIMGLTVFRKGPRGRQHGVRILIVSGIAAVIGASILLNNEAERARANKQSRDKFRELLERD